jgi:hypothetical protein
MSQRYFYGWNVVAATFVMGLFSFGLGFYGVTVYGLAVSIALYALLTGQGVLDRPDGSRCPSYGRQYRTDRHKPGLALSARDRIP